MDADGARDGVATPPGAKEPALELAGLVKRFGETTAVDHIDLVVPRGSFFGLVGPNGAGKTTTLSMAVGLLRPDAGTAARSSGADVWADPVAAKRLVGRAARRPGDARAADRPRAAQLPGPAAGPGPRDASPPGPRSCSPCWSWRAPSARWWPTTRPGCARRSAWPPRCCMPRGCWCWTSRSRRSTRCRRRRSGRSCGGSSPAAARWCSPATSWPLVEQLCDHVGVIANGRLAAVGTLDEVRGGVAGGRLRRAGRRPDQHRGPVMAGLLTPLPRSPAHGTRPAP